MRDEAEYARLEEGLRRERLRFTFGLMCAAWLLMSAVCLIGVIGVRYFVAGQVGLEGLHISPEELSKLTRLDWQVAPLVTLVVALVVGWRCFDDQAIFKGPMVFSGPERHPVQPWFSFWLPILVGSWAFVGMYAVVFGNAVRA